VAREPFVQERVVRVQKFPGAPAFDHDTLEEHFGFGPKSLPERIIEVWENALHRDRGVEVAQEEPLSGEVLDKRVELRVGHHAFDLAMQDGRLGEAPGFSQIEKPVVRDRTP
jgi:hypothetical protein